MMGGSPPIPGNFGMMGPRPNMMNQQPPMPMNNNINNKDNSAPIQGQNMRKLQSFFS